MINQARVEHVEGRVVDSLIIERIDSATRNARLDHTFGERLRHEATIEHVAQDVRIVVEVVTRTGPSIVLLHHLLEFAIDAEGVAEVAWAELEGALGRLRGGRAHDRVVRILPVELSGELLVLEECLLDLFVILIWQLMRRALVLLTE